MNIYIITERLSDGSEVSNVELNDGPDNRVVFKAVTASDAMSLAQKLESAIARHTNEAPRLCAF